MPALMMFLAWIEDNDFPKSLKGCHFELIIIIEQFCDCVVDKLVIDLARPIFRVLTDC